MAQARLELAGTDLARVKKIGTRAISETEVDTRASNERVAQATVEQLKQLSKLQSWMSSLLRSERRSMEALVVSLLRRGT